MATTYVISGPPVLDGGTVLHGGNIASDRWNNSALTTNNSLDGYGGKDPNPSKLNGVASAFKGAAVTLTSVADSSDPTGFCDFTLSSHGLSVGDVLFVSGATAGALNRTHVITRLPDANSIVTNVAYVASATAGTYKLMARNFGMMVEGEYVGKIIGVKVAGTADTFLRSGASDTSSRVPFNAARGSRRYHITSWNYATGVATKGANAGDRITYIDPETGSTQAFEPYPTMAVPGRLVYRDGSKDPIKDTYGEVTNP